MAESKLTDVFNEETIKFLKENKDQITEELLTELRKYGNEGKQLALDILDTEKDSEDYYLDAFGNRISFNGNRLLKKSYTQMKLSDIHIKELQKCKEDIYYFMDNYVKIKTNRGINFPELREYQRGFIEALCDPVESLVSLQPRQSGKSVTTGIYLTWKFMFEENMNIGICANKSKLAAEFLENVKNNFIELPMWMKIGISVWNKGSIVAENKMRILTDATSGDSFRGFSIAILVVDECAFIKQSVYSEFENSIFPAQSALSWKKNIIISTANGLNHFYNIVKGSKIHKTVENVPEKDLSKYVYINKTANEDGTYNLELKQGKNGYELYEVNWRDTPRFDVKGNRITPDEFKDKIVGQYGMVYWNQNYANKFIGSSNTFIDAKFLEKMVFEDPQEIRDNKLNIYKYPEPGHKYIFAVDPAKDGADSFAIQVLDVTTIQFEQVASANLQVDYMIMPEYIDEYARYYNNAYLIIENNEGAGQSIADMLKNDYEYENLYYDKIKRDSSTSQKTKKYPGFRTTTKTRKQILAAMRTFIENNKLVIHDKKTVNEFFTFILINDKYQADDGCHDDAIMSLALAFAPFCNTKNFSEMTELVKQIHSSENTEVDFVNYLTVGSFDDNGDDEYEIYSQSNFRTYE